MATSFEQKQAKVTGQEGTFFIWREVSGRHLTRYFDSAPNHCFDSANDYWQNIFTPRRRKPKADKEAVEQKITDLINVNTPVFPTAERERGVFPSSQSRPRR
jgi:hypothetical protein